MDLLKEYAQECFRVMITEYGQSKEYCRRISKKLEELKRLQSRSFVDTTRSRGTATYEDYMATIADLSLRLKYWQDIAESAKLTFERFLNMIDYDISEHYPKAAEVREYARLKHIEGYTWKDLIKKYGQRENDNLAYALCVYKSQISDKLGVDIIGWYIDRVAPEVAEVYKGYKKTL